MSRLSLSTDTKIIKVRSDAKGRITLGKLADGISSFMVFPQPGGSFLLEPMVEIPAREKWLFENKGAIESVKRGLTQSAKGKVRSRRLFAKFVNEKDE
ncbi:MAG: hypothetical protein HY843_05095 [Bdellovibrio sp.]|nr:hypothetical protein [Bdellovibrio sp.]